MDDRRFDAFARSLASGASRRQVLKGMLGLGAGTAAAALILIDDADAARRGYPGPPFISPPCRPSCDGSTCGDDGCGGTCSCSFPCDCLPEALLDPPPGTPRICVSDVVLTAESCTEFPCDSDTPTCEPVSGACYAACTPLI